MHNIDWAKVFSPDTPILEIIVRGTVTYISLFMLLRVILRRESGGSIGITDMLVIVLLADASQNAMSGGYHSLSDGCSFSGSNYWLELFFKLAFFSVALF
jgi:hypothetical protein